VSSNETSSTLPSDSPVLYELINGIATITFNRPEKYNALDPPASRLFMRHLRRAQEDDDVKAVILTGAGRAFCAGGDTSQLEEVAKAGFGKADSEADEPIRPDLASRIPKPVIAAINGPAAGVGLAYALACDMRFAAEDATLTFAFSRYGLVAEMGVSWMLPRLVGTSRALDLLWTSRRFTGREALDFGLVDYALPKDEVLTAAQAYAVNLIENVSAYSLAVMKSQVYDDWNKSLPDSVDRATQLIHEMLHSGQFRMPDK
jgi:enoyl-CoA hydratase/carnithine racemase